VAGVQSTQTSHHGVQNQKHPENIDIAATTTKTEHKTKEMEHRTSF
jgi:hypothetical protein